MSNKETPHQIARRFMSKIQARNPELYSILLNKADWFLRNIDLDKSPSEIKDAFRGQLNQMPDLNPIMNPDTFGIKMAIDAVEEDKEKARDAKSLFRNTLDQAFKENRMTAWGNDMMKILDDHD